MHCVRDKMKLKTTCPGSYLPLLRFTITTIILVCACQRPFAQTGSYTCPPNIDFEQGSFLNWQTNIGTVTLNGTRNVVNLPADRWLVNGNTAGRHELIDRTSANPTTDLYGGFPVNSPTGGRYSLMLGSDADMGVCGQNNDPCPNALAEAARYVIQVPADANNASITFSYAVVLENPNDAQNVHRDEEQPRFSVRMYDPATGEVIPCADFGFMASGPLPGFSTSPIRKRRDAAVRYKPWSSVYVNLSKYAGRTFYLEFTTADCTKGGHFGYAYVDVAECGVSAKSLYRCSAPSRTTLIGPPGFEGYEWYNENFTTRLGTTQNLVLSPSPALGTKYWVVTAPYANTGCLTCDCRDTVEVKVSVTYPVADAGEDGIACPGKPINLGSSAVDGYSYQWTNASQLSNPQGATTMAIVSTPTQLELTVTDTLGCSAKDTVAIRIYEPISVTASNASICTYETARLNASGASNYIWSPATGLSSATTANPVAQPATTTTYTVIGTDAANCYSDTAQAIVTVRPTPTVSLGPDVTMAIGEFLTLRPTVTNGPIISWLWSPGNTLTCTSCSEPTAEIKWNTTYRVTVRNEANCLATDSINIRTICPNSTVYIPNAFTPDGDGVNDVFMIQGKNIYVVKSFRVFNRWGELVFEKLNIVPNNPAYGWDGKIRGMVGSPDVYVYTAEVMCGGETPHFFKGNVSLLK